ncbi:hypothetical protein ACJX0J_039781, partial [Zea mays]
MRYHYSKLVIFSQFLSRPKLALFSNHFIIRPQILLLASSGWSGSLYRSLLGAPHTGFFGQLACNFLIHYALLGNKAIQLETIIHTNFM